MSVVLEQLLYHIADYTLGILDCLQRVVYVFLCLLRRKWRVLASCLECLAAELFKVLIATGYH
jgi:hypothetical protein